MVLGAEPSGGLARPFLFSERILLERDRERLKRTGDLLRVESHGGRIDPPAQIHSHRDVRDEMAAHRILDLIVECFQKRRLAHFRVAGKESRFPVPLDRQRTVPDVVRKIGSRIQLARAFPDAIGSRHALVKQELGRGLQCQFFFKSGIFQQRPAFGREQKAAFGLRVVERFLPHPVPRQEQHVPALIPEGESEHAVQKSERVHAFLLVQMDNDL